MVGAIPQPAQPGVLGGFPEAKHAKRYRCQAIPSKVWRLEQHGKWGELQEGTQPFLSSNVKQQAEREI